MPQRWGCHLSCRGPPAAHARTRFLAKCAQAAEDLYQVGESVPRITRAAQVAERLIREATETTFGGDHHRTVQALRALQAAEGLAHGTSATGAQHRLKAEARRNAEIHLKLSLSLIEHRP